MPVFVEDPGQFSKQRLRSELLSHNVELPLGETKKRVYVELYMKHVGNKANADFSSDDEDQIQNGDGETEQGEESDMVDLSSLTDDQLKDKLLEYGVKAGPIVASTRTLYERKLHRLLEQASEHRCNSTSDARRYSDSEEEGQEEEDEEESGSELYDSEMASYARTSVTATTIENKLSPQSRPERTERGSNYTPLASRGQWEPVTDVLMELFPDAAVTPTGITATKRRSIKGAAGRPVQFKYPETPMSPTSLERQEIRRRLVPLWVQIAVFLLVAVLLYLIYVSMENPSDNPLGALLDSLSQEAVSDEDSLIPSSQS